MIYHRLLGIDARYTSGKTLIIHCLMYLFARSSKNALRSSEKHVFSTKFSVFGKHFRIPLSRPVNEVSHNGEDLHLQNDVAVPYSQWIMNSKYKQAKPLRRICIIVHTYSFGLRQSAPFISEHVAGCLVPQRLLSKFFGAVVLWTRCGTVTQKHRHDA